MLKLVSSNKSLVLFMILLVGLFLVVGCSSNDEEMNTVGESGVLRVNFLAGENDNLVEQQNTGDKSVEVITIEIQNNDTGQVKEQKKIKRDQADEISFAELETGEKYNILVEFKDKQGTVIREVKKTSTTIVDSSVTEVDINLAEKQSEDGEISTAVVADDQAVIYYKRGFATPHMHYAVDGVWTDVPGVEMNDSKYEGYSVLTIELGETSEVEAVFNDGNGNWDNNGGNNYVFPAGISTYNNGNITAGEPEFNELTVYYKRGFATPHMHYAVDGAWTDVPGVEMNDSEYEGYSVLTIELGEASEVEAVFNDGNGNWDSNEGNNYIFPAGTITFADGEITEGTPGPDPEPTIESLELDKTETVVEVGDSYTLPETATAVMSDGSEKEVTVTWDKEVDTSQEQTEEYTGSVEGTELTVKFALTVEESAGGIGIDVNWETAPAAPKNLSADTNDNTVTLEWNRVDQDLAAADDSTKEFGGYYIYRSTEEGELGTAVQSNLIKDNNYLDEDVEAGETYYYQIRAYGGNSGSLAGDFSEMTVITIN